MIGSNKSLDIYVDEAWRFLRSMGKLSDPHGENHVDRVLRICKYILDREGGDSNIVYIAAILHDVGKNSGDKHKHADRSCLLYTSPSPRD